MPRLSSVLKREEPLKDYIERTRVSTIKRRICELKADMASLEKGTPLRELYVISCISAPDAEP